MTRAYSYIRFSTPEQLKGDSLRRQLEKSKTYAKENKLELDDSIRDLGVSAYKGKNREFGALSRFCERVRRGDIENGSYLLIESLDRLSRDEVLEALKLFLEITGAGVTIVTLVDRQVYNQATMTADPMRIMYSIMIMMRAHDESSTKAERVAMAWANKRKLATEKKLTARCPEWLQLSDDRKHFRLVPERVAIVQRIFRDCVSGLGKRAIAKRLNADGIPAFRGKRGWHDSAVQKILCNNAVIGIYQPHTQVTGYRVPAGEPVRGYYPAVIDETLFWQARAATEARAKFPGRKGKSFSNLFSGLCVCLDCQAKMVFVDKGRPPKGGRYLVCGNSRRGLCYNNRHYPYNELERSILAHIAELNFSDVFGLPNETHDVESRLAAQQAATTAFKKKQYALIEGFDDKTPKAVAKRIEMLEAEIAASEAKEVELRRRLKKLRVRKGPDEHIRAVELLREEMRIKTGDELFLLRARIASEIRNIVETMLFGSKSVDVVLLGYVKVYRFEGGTLTHVYPIWKMHKLKPSDSAISDLAPDVEKARRLKRLISTLGEG